MTKADSDPKKDKEREDHRLLQSADVDDMVTIEGRQAETVIKPDDTASPPGK